MIEETLLSWINFHVCAHATFQLKNEGIITWNHEKKRQTRKLLLRKHCCPESVSPFVHTQHSLRKHFLSPRNKSCFWTFSETFCFRNKCFFRAQTGTHCYGKTLLNVSATMVPRFAGFNRQAMITVNSHATCIYCTSTGVEFSIWQWRTIIWAIKFLNLKWLHNSVLIFCPKLQGLCLSNGIASLPNSQLVG